MIGHALIITCIALMVYGQLVIRWKVRPSGTGTLGFSRAAWISSGVLATALRALLWLIVLAHFEVSYAYPLMSTAFALVVLFGVWLLGEQFTRGKVVGSALIIVGVALVGASN